MHGFFYGWILSLFLHDFMLDLDHADDNTGIFYLYFKVGFQVVVREPRTPKSIETCWRVTTSSSRRRVLYLQWCKSEKWSNIKVSLSFSNVEPKLFMYILPLLTVNFLSLWFSTDSPQLVAGESARTVWKHGRRPAWPISMEKTGKNEILRQRNSDTKSTFTQNWHYYLNYRFCHGPWIFAYFSTLSNFREVNMTLNVFIGFLHVNM